MWWFLRSQLLVHVKRLGCRSERLFQLLSNFEPLLSLMIRYGVLQVIVQPTLLSFHLFDLFVDFLQLTLHVRHFVRISQRTPNLLQFVYEVLGLPPVRLLMTNHGCLLKIQGPLFMSFFLGSFLYLSRFVSLFFWFLLKREHTVVGLFQFTRHLFLFHFLDLLFLPDWLKFLLFFSFDQHLQIFKLFGPNLILFGRLLIQNVHISVNLLFLTLQEGQSCLHRPLFVICFTNFLCSLTRRW